MVGGNQHGPWLTRDIKELTVSEDLGAKIGDEIFIENEKGIRIPLGEVVNIEDDWTHREISLFIVTGILVLIIILALVAYIKRSSEDCQSVTHLQQTVSTNNKNREDSSRNTSQGAGEKELTNQDRKCKF